ncbi:hypothetical protein MMC21_005655 [Puttea exsequens]|nr:hypothetical protein [Puttea exsequens]
MDKSASIEAASTNDTTQAIKDEEKTAPDASSPSQAASTETEKGRTDQTSTERIQIDRVIENNDVPMTTLKLAILIVALTLVVFLMMLDIAIIATAIPRITSDFHSLRDVGWYGSAYLIASCAVQPLTGKIYTYFNNKYSFLTFMAFFELGSLICGIAPSSNVLIVGRAVAGMGASGLMNGAITIMAACIPMEKRPLILGVMISFAQIGTVIGPLIGGALTQYASWRWCFYINLPPGGVVAVLLVLIRVPDQTIKTGTYKIIFKKLDLIGFALFAPAAIQCLLALEWGGVEYAWSSATIIGLFCGTAGTLAVFISWEYRKGEEAMIPLSMVRKRIVWSSCLTLAFFFGTVLIMSYYLPIYFQAVRGASPTMSGVYMLPGVISQVVFATVSGALVGRFGYYLPWIVGCGSLVTLGMGLLCTLTPTTPTAHWVGFQILVGVGRGMGVQMPIIAIQNMLPPAQIPTGMAVSIFSQMFGGALFLALAQTDFANSITKALAVFAPEADVRAVIAAGATAVRHTVSAQDLHGIILAYDRAYQHAFYLGVGCGGGMFIACWGMGWGKVKKSTPLKPVEEKESV